MVARFVRDEEVAGSNPVIPTTNPQETAGFRRFALHPTSIAQKVEVVVEHFRRNVAHHLDGQARAMVVTSSRKAAVRWAREMNRYITEKGYEFHSLVAFSDAVRMEDEPDPVTEVSMNGESDVERAFKDDDLDYRVLIVANKFQTGFNEPRLCAMYVDKHLDLTPVR